MTNRVRITPLYGVKHLRVIFDNKLQYKIYLQYIIGKDIKAAMVLNNIAKSN